MNLQIHDKLKHLIRDPVVDWDSSKDLKFQIVDWFANDFGDDECKSEIEKTNEENEENEEEKDDNAFGNRCIFRDPRKYEVCLFGVTPTGESVYAKVEDYKPFFYLKLPKQNAKNTALEFYKLLQKKNYAHKFNNADKTEKAHFHQWSSGIIGMNFLERYDLDAGFTNKEKFSFVEIIFANQSAMKKCSNLIRNFQAPYNTDVKRKETSDDKKLKNICNNVKLYESNIDPMLRFMHLRDIQSTGWVVLKSGSYKFINVADRQSTCQIEAKVKWDKVDPDNDDNNVAPIRQASFDIECYSHDRKFPKPEDIQNKCIQIATAIKDYGSKDFTIKHILALGPCKEIDGAVVDVCETEAELLCKWALLLRKLDPDVVVGYNIFGFDLNYVMVRAEKLGVLDHFAFMSKLINYKCVITKKELKSKAYGANYYLMVEMPGRFQLDLYPHIKKEQKYVSYKLDYVAEQILGERKHDVSPKEISDGFASGDVDRITKIAAYCIQDTLLPQLIIDKMNILINLIEMGKVTYVPLSYLINRGQQIKVFSHVAKTARLSGYLMAHIFQERIQEGVVKRLKTEKIFTDEDEDEDEDEEEETYEGATVLDPDIGFYDEPIACLDFMSLYPTIEIDWNLDYASLVKDYFKYGRIPNVPYHSVFIPIPPPDDSPEPSPVWAKLRITLFEATGRIYLDFVGVPPPEEFINKLKRFNGYRQELGDLYVPYVCKLNDHDNTKYNSKDHPQWSVPYAPNTMKFLYRTFAGAKTRKLYLWGENFQGLIPKVLVHLLGARSKAKKQQEDATDPFMKSVFEGKQLALKVCCNSVYGFTGAVKSGMLPCKPVAECTTTIGRWMIESSRDFAQNIENFRDIMKYTTVFPENYPYICRNVVDPEKPKFYLSDIKGIISKSFKNWEGRDNNNIWEILHNHFSESSISSIRSGSSVSNGSVSNCSKSITIPLVQTAKGTFDIYTTEGFSSIISVTIENDPFKKGDIVYKLNTEKGETISINQHAVKTFSSSHVDDKGYKAHVVYGDSVTASTPILCKFPDGKIGYRTIDNLSFNGEKLNWIQYGNQGKEQCVVPFEVWTEKGWTKLNRVIRHRTDKDIYQILTHTAYVQVTSDHSLLDKNANIVKPSDVHVGKQLLHANLPYSNNDSSSISDDEAYPMGLFWSDGSCGSYDCPSGEKSSWAINNQNLEFLQRAKECLERVYPNFKFVVLDTMKSSRVYKLVPKGGKYGELKGLVTKYRKLFYDDHNNLQGIGKGDYTYKHVPDCILNSTLAFKRLFMQGYYDGDGDKNNICRFDNKGEIGCAGLYFIQNELGYNCSINNRKDKPDVFRITCTRNTPRKSQDIIKKILNVGKTSDYVYDLETENHHFSAGIGRMIVHNTDSIFTKFFAPQFSTLEKKIAYNMICGSYAADRITEFLRSMNKFKDDKSKWTTLQYEKVYGMLLMFSKKRYAGTLFSANPCKYAYIDKKGVALKRRDFCILVKEIYGDCLKILFDESLGEPRVRLELAITRAKNSIEDLLNHRVPIEKLELSNLLNDEYKMREQKIKKDKKLINTFNENNVFMHDLIVIQHPKYGLIEGKIVAKRDHDKEHFFERTKYKKPIDAYFKVETEVDGQSVVEFQGKLDVDYGDIKSKSGFTIALKKILDPLTDERELALVTQAHVRLARKMFMRDAGSAPCSGERVAFVYVENDSLPQDCLQWQKAEHPLFAKEHNLKLDVLYYLEHQLRSPITQIFSLIMKDPDSLFDGFVIDYKNKQQKQTNIQQWFGQPIISKKSTVSKKRQERENNAIDNAIDNDETNKSNSETGHASRENNVKDLEYSEHSRSTPKTTTKKQKIDSSKTLKQTGLSGWLKK